MSHLVRRALLRAPHPSAFVNRPLVVTRRRLICTTFARRQAVDEAVTDAPVASLNDAPVFLEDDMQVDWSRSFHGLSAQPFGEEVSKILTSPLDPEDVEIKPGTLHGRPALTGRWNTISS